MWSERSAVGSMVMRGGARSLGGVAALGRIVRRRPVDSLGTLAAILATGAIVTNALFLQASPHPAPILPVKPRPVATGEITSSLPRAPVASPTSPAPVAPAAPVVQAKLRPAESVTPKAEAPAREAAAREASTREAPTAARTRPQIVSDIQRELSRRGFFDGPVDGVYGPKTDAAIRDFEHAAGIKGNAQPDDALLRLITRSSVHAAPTQAAVPPSTPAPAPARATASAPARTAAPSPASAAVPRPPAPIHTAASSAAPSKRILSVQRALADFGYGQVAPTGVLGAETKSAIERFERERKLPVTGQISERLIRELAAVTGRPLE
jgi:peptidoglycan hydrolase-like protein with peptidoglycan-binding domain